MVSARMPPTVALLIRGAEMLFRLGNAIFLLAVAAAVIVTLFCVIALTGKGPGAMTTGMALEVAMFYAIPLVVGGAVIRYVLGGGSRR